MKALALMTRKDFVTELINLLIVHFSTERERQALLYIALGDTAIYRRIDLSGSPQDFTERLLELFQNYELDGKYALRALLMKLLEHVGIDQQHRINRVIETLSILFNMPSFIHSEKLLDPRILRIFLSSPEDVEDERAIARRVIDDLRADPFFRDNIIPEVISWEDLRQSTATLTTLSPQQAIDRGLLSPAECDIVVVILWSRMGIPLDLAKYSKSDGSAFSSSTEWEFENAIESTHKVDKPYVLVYRRAEKLALDPDAPEFEEKLKQYRKVKAFFETLRNPDGPWRQRYTWYIKPEHFRQYLEIDLRLLINRILRDSYFNSSESNKEQLSSSPIWDPAKSPFPGLRAFMPADAPVFFGQGHKTDDLVRLVALTRFVAVLGASGSGKSSLVGAGLLPRLMDGAVEGSRDWLWLRFTPGSVGDNPFTALAVELKKLASDVVPRSLAGQLEANPEVLEIIIRQALSGQPEWSEVLLFIDQFEELFTLCAPFCVSPFITLLELATSTRWLRVIITMRSDFYHRCIEIPTMARLLKLGLFSLSIPEPLDLIEMIERPAKVANLILSDGLARQIVREVGNEPGGLPLMGHLLDELYKIAQDRGVRTLTSKDYKALGGVKGAIGTRAENMFAGLPGTEVEKVHTLHQVFHQLIEVDENGIVSRRRAPLAALIENSDNSLLVSAFVEARLLVTTETAGHEPQVEVAHEALFTSWETLAEWISTIQDDLRTIRQYERDARDWVRRGKPLELKPKNDQLKVLINAAERLREHISNPLVIEFTDLNVEPLLREVEDTSTSHQRRLFISERVGFLGDPRFGVGNEEFRVGTQTMLLPSVEWCYVDADMALDDRPKRLTNRQSKIVRSFWIAKYLITNQQFQAFLDDSKGYSNPAWWKGIPLNYVYPSVYKNRGRFPTSPRDTISWYQAVAFTRWLTNRQKGMIMQPLEDSSAEPQTVGEGIEIRLPTEREWQWAAQGGFESRKYPWPGEWDSQRANTLEAGLEESTVVGMYLGGKAYCGALDMAGNVWEWCLDRYDREAARVLRGGSFFNNLEHARCTFRSHSDPYNMNYRVGFRVVCAPNSVNSMVDND